jgi:hypothetical protein
MKQKNDNTNKKTTALAGAVAATTIGLLTSFVLPRKAAAGAGRIPVRTALVEALGISFCDTSKICVPGRPAGGGARGGFVARPLQVNGAR